MHSLDEIGVDIAEGICAVIEENTSANFIDSDRDILTKINELTELVLEKYTTFHEEEVEGDTELHGDMDSFPS